MTGPTYRILAEGREVSNDTRATGLNNNDVIIGPSGAGKTRGYILPNILQCSESMVIADTKGRLQQDVGGVLEREGYQVVGIDFTDCLHSWGYNPLAYIRYDKDRGVYRQQDIITAAACIAPLTTTQDPFWDLSARMFLESILAYILECLPEAEHHLESAVTLFQALGDRGRYRKLMEELSEVDPDSFAVARYYLANTVAGSDKTYACIQSFLASHLSTLAFDGAVALYKSPRQLRLEDLGRRKTAVFLNISDTDRSMDRLVNLFYAQALHILCDSADRDGPDHRLPVPVRFLLDDFAANVRIPDFDKIISVIRSRDISVSIVIQSLSQLETLYTQAQAQTILNNCDNCLYLGGQDVSTARYIGVKADKPAQAILNMPLDRAWLFTRGAPPQSVRKYDPSRHPRYPGQGPRSGPGVALGMKSPDKTGPKVAKTPC